MDSDRLKKAPKLAELKARLLANSLHGDSAPGDALRSCEMFCSHGGSLHRCEIDHLLKDGR